MKTYVLGKIEGDEISALEMAPNSFFLKLKHYNLALCIVDEFKNLLTLRHANYLQGLTVSDVLHSLFSK